MPAKTEHPTTMIGHWIDEVARLDPEFSEMDATTQARFFGAEVYRNQEGEASELRRYRIGTKPVPFRVAQTIVDYLYHAHGLERVVPAWEVREKKFVSPPSRSGTVPTSITKRVEKAEKVKA